MRVDTGFAGEPIGEAGITIGTFDGVHLAHRRAVEHLVATDRAQDRRTVVLTFDRHPRCIVDPTHCPRMLTTLDEKLELLAALGVDITVVVPFTREVAALSAADFMGLVRSRIQVRHLLSGPDFALGHNRQGDTAWLRAYGATNGFSTEVMPLLKVDGIELHSSDIRRHLEAGEVAEAARLLGRPFRLTGPVEGGARVGRTLGFPTANIGVSDGKLIPAEGVYAVRVATPAGPDRGALSIGRRPTFDGAGLVVEVFLLDHRGDLYGQRLTMDLVERIRGQVRYESPGALAAQIAADVEETRRILP